MYQFENESLKTKRWQLSHEKEVARILLSQTVSYDIFKASMHCLVSSAVQQCKKWPESLRSKAIGKRFHGDDDDERNKIQPFDMCRFPTLSTLSDNVIHQVSPKSNLQTVFEG